MKSFNAVHPTIGTGLGLVAGEEGCDATVRGADGSERRFGLFVGVRQEPSLPWRMLPLFASPVAAGDEPFEILSGARYGRTFALASDRWLIGPLVFKLCTPFWKTSDPATCDRDTARLHFAPSIGGFVEYDNTHSEEPVEVLVGAGAPGAAFQPVGTGLVGFSSQGRFGFATAASPDVRQRLANTPFVEARADSGDYASLVFTIAAREKKVFPFALAIQSGDGAPLHRSLFEGVDGMLASSLANNAEIIRRSDELDAGWFGSPGSREEKITRAHVVRQHMAGTCVTKTGGVPTLTGPRRQELDAEIFPWTISGPDL